MRLRDLSGMVFGNLTVLKRAERAIRNIYFVCKCTCGKEKEVRRDHLLTNKITHCGCRSFEVQSLARTKHGLSGNPLYFVWTSMMDRCYNEQFEDYHNYGGRGIKVCDEWHDMKVFISDMQEGYSKGLQLDRKENDKDYSKSNCRWATRKQNNRNKRTNLRIEINGVTLTACEWAEISGVYYPTIVSRFRRGVRGEDVISTLKLKYRYA